MTKSDRKKVAARFGAEADWLLANQKPLEFSLELIFTLQRALQPDLPPFAKTHIAGLEAKLRKLGYTVTTAANSLTYWEPISRRKAPLRDFLREFFGPKPSPAELVEFLQANTLAIGKSIGDKNLWEKYGFLREPVCLSRGCVDPAAIVAGNLQKLDLEEILSATDVLYSVKVKRIAYSLKASGGKEIFLAQKTYATEAGSCAAVDLVFFPNDLRALVDEAKEADKKLSAKPTLSLATEFVTSVGLGERSEGCTGPYLELPNRCAPARPSAAP